MFFNQSEIMKNQNIKYSVSRLFSHAIIAVITVILVIFSVMIILHNHYSLEKQLNMQLNRNASLAVITLPTAVWAIDMLLIHNFFDAVFTDEAVVFVEIMYPEQGVPNVEKSLSVKKRSDFKDKEFSFFKKSSRFIVKETDIEMEGRKVGILQIAMSRDAIRRQLIFNIASVATMMFFIIAAISLTSFWVTRQYISRPLMKLADSARQIAGGNLDIPVSSDREDEIGSLAQDFNVMRESVRQANKKIEEQNKHLEKEAEKRRELEHIINQSPVVVFLWKNDPGWSVEYVSESVSQFGYTPDDFISGRVPYAGIVFPDDLSRVGEEVGRYSREKRLEFEQKYRIINRSGDVRWTEDKTWIRYDGQGNITHYQGIVTDVTPRKEKEELEKTYKARLEKDVEERTRELSETLESLKAAQNELIQSEKMAALGQLIAGVAHEINTPLGAIRASVGNISDSLNETLEQMPRLFKILSEEEYRNFSALTERALQSRNIFSAKEERKMKRTLTGILEGYDIDDAGSFADTLTDMGVYDNIELFLPLFRHTESAFILKTAYNLSGLRRGSRNIATAADRASKVVFALKSYARFDHSGEKTNSDLTEGIETVLTLYHNQLKQGIEVIRSFEKLPLIPCYPDELNQVWTNIIHNAVQAMDGKGTLEIEISQKDSDAAVRFTDSGKGIPDEIKQRIFEPFFTTKAAGEGSGLGLHIVKKIIDKHNGKIEIESRPGKTVLCVFIPMSL